MTPGDGQNLRSKQISHTKNLKIFLFAIKRHRILQTFSIPKNAFEKCTYFSKNNHEFPQSVFSDSIPGHTLLATERGAVPAKNRRRDNKRLAT